jgi:hypothetical protein
METKRDDPHFQGRHRSVFAPRAARGVYRPSVPAPRQQVGGTGRDGLSRIHVALNEDVGALTTARSARPPETSP